VDHREHAVGCPRYGCVVGDDDDRHGALVAARAEQREPIVRQANMVRRDGEQVLVEKSYRDAGTTPDGAQLVIAIARDVTRRLAAERELAEHQHSLRAAERELALAVDRERIATALHGT
jgi:PAS domain S-box-containing protein